MTYIGAKVIFSCSGNKNYVYLGWLIVIISLSPLLIFKYYNFINQNISYLLSRFGIVCQFNAINWAVPVGISFYSFQAVGYFLDVYHKKIKPESNILDYFIFISFFPQISSGPISRAVELLPQIKKIPQFKYQIAVEGCKHLLWGFFIKLVIADRIGLFVDTVYSNYQYYNGGTCLIASILYSIQIYCDFSGYSLMAIGFAKLLGFNIINNFNRPYFASSITDFWRRWHISLTRWLTQYIYIPLGGSRCSKFRNYFNIFIVFFISGIWHGASWTFIFWGIIHAFVQIIEKVLGLNIKHENQQNVFFRILLTFSIATFAWIFFRMPTIQDAFAFISNIFVNIGVPDFSDMGLSSLLIVIISVSMLFLKEYFEEYPSELIKCIYNRICFRWSLYLLLVVMILVFGIHDGGQFIYVNF